MFCISVSFTYSTCNRQCFNEVTVDKTIPKIISIHELVQTELCDDNSHNIYDLPSLTIGKRFPARYKGLAFLYTNSLNNQILNLFSHQSQRIGSNERHDEAFDFTTKSHDHQMDTTIG